MLIAWLSSVVNEEISVAPDEEEEPAMKKRHLNVVFIGHVGELMIPHGYFTSIWVIRFPFSPFFQL